MRKLVQKVHWAEELKGLSVAEQGNDFKYSCCMKLVFSKQKLNFLVCSVWDQAIFHSNVSKLTTRLT